MPELDPAPELEAPELDADPELDPPPVSAEPGDESRGTPASVAGGPPPLLAPPEALTPELDPPGGGPLPKITHTSDAHDNGASHVRSRSSGSELHPGM
jgi:hypothetical protein